MGSSHISHLRQFNRSNPLMINNCTLIFKDRPGAKITHIAEMLEKAKVRGERAPNYVILHIGSNDLGTVSCKEMREKLNRLFKCFRQAVPRAQIIWSDILPRRFWTEADNQVSIEKTRKILNKLIRHDLLTYFGGKAIRHINIGNIYQNFKRYDVVHLSQCGYQIFANNILQGLKLFFADNSAILYPPSTLNQPRTYSIRAVVSRRL